MPSRLVLSLALLLLVAGCGDDDTTTVTVRETVTETAASSVPNEAPALVALYFLQDGEVWPEQRGLVTGPAIATNTVHQLFEGTESELTSAIPPETRLRSLAIKRGVASIVLDPAVTDPKALAQLIYTLTQFDSVQRVSFNGDPSIRTRGIRGRDRDPRRVSPLPRGGRVGFRGDRDGEHVRGDVPVRASRCRRRQDPEEGFRDRDVRKRHARDISVHRSLRGVRPGSPRRLRDLGRGRLEDEQTVDPARYADANGDRGPRRTKIVVTLGPSCATEGV